MDSPQKISQPTWLSGHLPMMSQMTLSRGSWAPRSIDQNDLLAPMATNIDHMQRFARSQV